jgi:hypothetical protein
VARSPGDDRDLRQHPVRVSSADGVYFWECIFELAS